MANDAQMPERIWYHSDGAYLSCQPAEHEGWQEFVRADLCAWEVQALYAHPPQPSETVAEALKLAAARLQRLALEIPSTTPLRADAFEWADAALRALKGADD